MADGAVARRLDACSALGESVPPPPGNPLPGSPYPPPPSTHLAAAHSLPAGAKLDDFADFTTFGLATALLLQPQGALDGLLAIAYVMAVFARLCFFSSGKSRILGGIKGFLGVISPPPHPAERLASSRDPIHLPGAALSLCLLAAGEHLPADGR